MKTVNSGRPRAVRHRPAHGRGLRAQLTGSSATSRRGAGRIIEKCLGMTNLVPPERLEPGTAADPHVGSDDCSVRKMLQPLAVFRPAGIRVQGGLPRRRVGRRDGAVRPAGCHRGREALGKGRVCPAACLRRHRRRPQPSRHERACRLSASWEGSRPGRSRMTGPGRLLFTSSPAPSLPVIIHG